MSTIREHLDPELHLLRSLALAQQGKARTQLESARFHLYSALEQGDADGARRWVESLAAAVDLHVPEGVRPRAHEALARIRERLG